MKPGRSGCPINLSLELLGDRWSLIVLRDIIFGDKRHFLDLLRRSEEGITPNMLTERLDRLEAAGVLTRSPDPGHAQRSRISLTEKGIALVPVLAQLSGWGVDHLPVGDKFRERSRRLRDGGPELWAALMDDLRRQHLGDQTDATTGGTRAFLNAGMETTPAKG